MMEGGVLLTITVLVLAPLIIGKCGSFYFEYLNKGNNKITELRTILQREIQSS